MSTIRTTYSAHLILYCLEILIVCGNVYELWPPFDVFPSICFVLKGRFKIVYSISHYNNRFNTQANNSTSCEGRNISHHPKKSFSHVHLYIFQTPVTVTNVHKVFLTTANGIKTPRKCNCQNFCNLFN
jgi:hypothetical protein